MIPDLLKLGCPGFWSEGAALPATFPGGPGGDIADLAGEGCAEPGRGGAPICGVGACMAATLERREHLAEVACDGNDDAALWLYFQQTRCFSNLSDRPTEVYC